MKMPMVDARTEDVGRADAQAMIRDYPVSILPGDGVVFAGRLVSHGCAGSAVRLSEIVLEWVRNKKAAIMRDGKVLDAYGADSLFSVRLVTVSQPDFATHKLLGRFGFRAERTDGNIAYTLGFRSNWSDPGCTGQLERDLRGVAADAIDPSRARDVAREFSRAFQRSLHTALDYAPQGLAAVTELFTQRERAGLSPCIFLPSTVTAVACYLGEVVVREVADSRWLQKADDTGRTLAAGPARLDPRQRVLDLFVRGREADLTGYLDDAFAVYFNDHRTEAILERSEAAPLRLAVG